MPPHDLVRTLEAALAQLPPGDIVVAFSGGLDSSVLLHALAHSPIVRARGLRALHIDHALHSDSTQWAAHCAAFATALEVPLRSIRVAVAAAAGTGLEDAARRARYAAFASALQRGQILALAHHRDDQAETVLLKLLRGGGPEGLAGMRHLRAFAQSSLWRPLLDTPRALLRDYAARQGLRWLDDPSNAALALRRNYLRHEILPRLQSHWPGADAALAHSAAWLRRVADYLEAQSAQALAQIRLAPATLAWPQWLALPDALRDPVLRRWLREVGLDEPAHFHVAELERQLRAPADRAPCLTFGHTELRRYRHQLHAMQRLHPVAATWQARWNGEPLPLPGGGTLSLQATHASVPSADCALRVCYRRGGERLRLAPAAPQRELRSLLQELGVPPWQRARLPLIYAGDELLGVGDLLLSTAGQSWCAARAVRFAFTRNGSTPETSSSAEK